VVLQKKKSRPSSKDPLGRAKGRWLSLEATTIGECRGVGIFSGLEWADPTSRYRLLSAHQGVIAELEYFRVWNGPIQHSAIGCYRPIKELSRAWNISGFGMGRSNIPNATNLPQILNAGCNFTKHLPGNLLSATDFTEVTFLCS
jgi:hypothetical protein